MPKTARDVMTPNAECVGENETLLDAAKKMADRGYGVHAHLRRGQPPQGHAHRPRHRREGPGPGQGPGLDHGPASSARASR